MTLKGSCRRELTELVTNHILGYINRNMLATVMNPNDHPHGGGEGKTGIGRPGPSTPWGKPALGYKTRQKNKRTDKYIVKRRK